MNPRKRLRELLAATRYVIVPGAYDTLTAWRELETKYLKDV